jgi:hypothetical protein
MTEGTPISYEGLARGTAVVSNSGRAFGTVEHVLEIPAEDLFDGIVVTTSAGLRFVDRDQIVSITDRAVSCAFDDAAAAGLPAPDGPPVYTVDAMADEGHSLHDVLGRLFRRPRWTREQD